MLIGMFHAAAVGLGPLWPADTMARMLVSPGAREGVLATLLGLLLFFVAAGVIGILYNAVTPRRVSYLWATGFGLVFGAVLFILVTWLVLPMWNPALYQTASKPVLFAYHLLFGLVVTLAVPMRRAATRSNRAPTSD